MSKISEGIEFLERVSCSICGNETKRGGYWSGRDNVAVCPSCLQQNMLAAILADGTLDTCLGRNRLVFLNHALEHFEKEFWRAACLQLLHEQRKVTKMTETPELRPHGD